MDFVTCSEGVDWEKWGTDVPIKVNTVLKKNDIRRYLHTRNYTALL